MLSRESLELDAAAAVAEIESAIRTQVLGSLRRRGAVVGVSGGVDSAVVAVLCARALGPNRVLGLMMPEHHSADESESLARDLGASLGIETRVESIAPVLEAAGCYERQTAAIRLVFPEFGEGWRCKVTLPSLLDGERLNVSRLTVESPAGERRSARMPPQAYRELIAATNFKQRARMMMAYHHAERLHYAVAGTPNRLEYDQGFFVRHGDGAADFKPIAHLYKTQVYQLAAFLGVPEAIRCRPPSTDTFSLPQTQEEFYFALPHPQLDLCLYGSNHGLPAAEIATASGLTTAQVERVLRDLEQKRRATRYLHLRPLLVRPVTEVGE
jgi:NAD+ synthase